VEDRDVIACVRETVKHPVESVHRDVRHEDRHAALSECGGPTPRTCESADVARSIEARAEIGVIDEDAQRRVLGDEPVDRRNRFSPLESSIEMSRCVDGVGSATLTFMR
jgi:hypothetical protein